MADTFPTKEEYTNETLENDGFKGSKGSKAMNPDRESKFQGKPKRGSKAMDPMRESRPKRMFQRSGSGPGNIIKKGPR